MAIQQLTQPIVNPIAAFDATKKQAITFVVIGGAQVVGNRLIIRNNQTGEIVYNQTQSSMKLEHILPANSLKNNNFYNAVIYTIDNGNDESVASVPIPFYCYTQPALTIDNIPSSGTIENGTYSFQGNYVQNEGELLNSYRFTLYDSNKTILAQSPLIYYNTDPSLTYLFSGMSNNTSYYIELTGETINSTILTSGVKSFTVRYIQPASFAICDLVNDCENGYIQISSNIVAIDGKSNPTPPKYIDDKEVDLREPDSWVEWDSGFSIKNDFTLRAWGRDFNPYEPIITLSNQQNTSSTPNKIEMKWMIADVLKVLPDYKRVSGQNINLSDSKAEPIEDIYVGGNTTQYKDAGVDYGSGTSLSIPAQDKIKPLKITVNGNQSQKTTTGINLFDYITPLIASGSGLTNTLNEDGSITTVGIPTANYSKVCSNVDFIDRLEDGETYTILQGTKQTGLLYMQISARKADGTYTYLNNSSDGKLTFKVNKATYRSYLVGVQSGTTASWGSASRTITNTYMLYKGTDEKDFEPYTGGKPSPSSDYLQKVETVGDNVNLLNNTASTTSINGIDITIFEDKTVLLNGTATKPVNIVLQRNILLDDGEEYTLNSGNKNASSSKFGLYINQYYDNSNHIQASYNSPLNFIYNIKSKNSNNIYVYVNKGATVENELLKPKLEKGSVASPYSMYNQGSVEVIKQNKNFIKLYDSDTLTWAGLTYTLNKNTGEILINGTSISNGWVECGYTFKGGTNPQTKILKKLKENETYTLSCRKKKRYC